MDLDLTDDQELFRETTRKFLEAELPTPRLRELADDAVGLDRDLWRRGAELGWFSMLVPEEHGGGTITDRGLADLAIAVEELGRALFPGPVVATNAVAAALAAGGGDAASEWLPGLAEGNVMATWALAEATGGWDPERVELTVAPSAGGYRLAGIKSPVEWAETADVLLVTGRTDAGGVAQFVVPRDARGITVTPLGGLDLTRRFAEVRFDDVEVTEASAVGPVGSSSDRAASGVELSIALQCAETVGALDRLFEMTLDYVKTRKAFGRPIGSFQALKHRLADMLLWLESSKAAAVAAVEAVQFGADAAEVVSIAKSYIADRGPAIARDCLQLHGGIGYTWEHDLHLFLRRIDANAAIYGGTREHRDRLASMVGFD